MADAVAAEKARLRAAAQERLRDLPAASAAAAAALAAQRFLALPEVAASRRLLVCLSFGDEISTRPVIAALEEGGRELFVPRADPRDGLLHVHPYPCALVTLPFGLCQPPRGAPEIAAGEIDRTLDAALVLGLAFDEEGFRLGHGRGYFDRFLAGRPFPAVGYAYEAQMVERLPREAHDVAMSAVVTEARSRRRRG